MPRFSAQVNINFSSNAKGVSGKASKELDKLTKSANKTSKAMQGLGRAAKGIAAAGVAAFTAAAKVAIQKGSEFETSMADLSAITGLTGQGLETVAGSALRMSRAYGIGASSIAKATKIVASAKSELLEQPDALNAITQQAIVLSKAARVELPSATKVLVESMNQFGLGADEAGRAINVLAAGSKFGASEVAETGDAILKAGVAAKSVGVNFEQTNAAIQVLAKNGLKAQLAGTQLKTAFIALASAGEDDFNPKIVGLSKALENLAGENLNTEEAVKLFGREAFAAGKILIDNRKLVDQWTTAVTGTNVATEQAKVNMNTFGQATARLRSSIESNLIEKFRQAEGPLTKIATRFTNLISPMNEAGKAASDSAGFWFEMADGLELVTEGLEKLVNSKAISKVTGLINGLSGAQDKLADAIVGTAKSLLSEEDARRIERTGEAETTEAQRLRLRNLRSRQSVQDFLPLVEEAAKAAREQASTKSTLEVKMKVDNDGRVRVDSVNSSEDLSFSAEMGLAVPGGG